jgi:hypothetical protein
MRKITPQCPILPGDDYTRDSRLPRDEVTGESRLPDLFVTSIRTG